MIRSFELSENDIKCAIADYIVSKNKDVTQDKIKVNLIADTYDQRGGKSTIISATAKIEE